MNTILDVLSLICRDKLDCFINIDDTIIKCSYQDILNITFYPEYIKLKGKNILYDCIVGINTDDYSFVRRGDNYIESIIDIPEAIVLSDDTYVL